MQRGEEKVTVRRIQADIVKYDNEHESTGRIVREVFPSKIPGYFYLITLNLYDMNPLCEYLHSFSSLLYDKPIVNRQHNFMPIHHLVTDFSSLQAGLPDEPQYSVGDWVTVKAPSDLYTGSLGLIVPDDERLDYPPGRSYAIITVPRIPRSFREEKAFVDNDIKPPISILSFADATAVCNLYKLEQLEHWGKAADPQWGPRIQSRCPTASLCSEDHSHEFFFRGQIFQCGLVLMSYRESGLSPAPATMDPSLLQPFISSHHPSLHLGSHKLPIPNTWNFRIGEKVTVANSGGAIGVISSVQDRVCEVNFENALESIPKLNLIKSFSLGDNVYVSNDGASGTIVLLNGLSAIVCLDERTVSVLRNEKQAWSETTLAQQGAYLKDSQGSVEQGESVVEFAVNALILVSTVLSTSSTANSSRIEPVFTNPIDSRTRKSIWVGRRVTVTKHNVRRGYKGVVSNVQCSSSATSGLIVQVTYDVLNLGPSGVEWLDYMQVRNEQ